jgi:hypothetical protein
MLAMAKQLHESAPFTFKLGDVLNGEARCVGKNDLLGCLFYLLAHHGILEPKFRVISKFAC